MPFADGKIDRITARRITSALAKNCEVDELLVRDDGVPTGMCANITKLDRRRVLSINESIMHDNEAGARAGATWALGR